MSPARGPLDGRRVSRLVRRRPAAVLSGLIALHLLLAALTFEPAPHSGGDNAVYVTLARALLEHGAYANLHEPGAPPHTQYPPGFAIVLAGALLLGLTTWVQLKLVVVLFSAAALAFTFLWIRRRGRPGLALGVSLLLAMSPAVLEQGRWVLSDVPFWAFTMAAVWALERLRPAERGRVVIALGAILAAYFTRSAALPLVIAAAAFLGARRRWRELAAGTVVIGVPALLWWLRVRAAGGVDYVDQFWHVNPYMPELGTIGAPDLLRRIVENAHRYVTDHIPVLLTGTAGPTSTAAAAGLCVLALFGWARALRRPGAAELLLPLYIGLILIWPAVWSGERFLLPVLPLLLYFAGDALVRNTRSLFAPAAFATGAAVVATLLLLAAPALIHDIRRGVDCTARYRAGDRLPCMHPAMLDFFEVAAWSRSALPDDAIVLSRKPSLFYTESGLPGTYYPLSAEPGALFGMADSLGARYVVLDGIDFVADRYLAPVLLDRPDAFCIMYLTEATGTAMLGLLPAGQPPPAEPATDADGAGGIALPVCDRSFWRAGLALRPAAAAVGSASRPDRGGARLASKPPAARRRRVAGA